MERDSAGEGEEVDEILWDENHSSCFDIQYLVL